MSNKKRKRRSVSSARVRAEKKQNETDFGPLQLPDGVKFFKVNKAGPIRLNIIPYEVGKLNPYAKRGELHYEFTYYVHRGIGANNDTIACPAKIMKTECPICEFRQQQIRNPDADPDLIKQLEPKERQLFVVQDVDNIGAGLQVWDVSYYLFGRMLDARIRNSDDDEGWENFHDLTDGFMLKIGIEERTFAGHSFYAAETIDFKPRKKPLDESLIDDAPCLDECVKIESYDSIKSKLLELSDDDDDDEVEDEKPKKVVKKSKSKREQDVDLDDDDDDDDDDDEVEDEDEKPKKVVKKSKSKREQDVDLDDDDDDEDWDDDDDDEDWDD